MENLATRRILDFARRMNAPRRAVRCEVYGTVSVEVDRSHARNILRKVFPHILSTEMHTALAILDERVADAEESRLAREGR